MLRWPGRAPSGQATMYPFFSPLQSTIHGRSLLIRHAFRKASVGLIQFSLLHKRSTPLPLIPIKSSSCCPQIAGLLVKTCGSQFLRRQHIHTRSLITVFLAVKRLKVLTGWMTCPGWGMLARSDAEPYSSIREHSLMAGM